MPPDQIDLSACQQITNQDRRARARARSRSDLALSACHHLAPVGMPAGRSGFCSAARLMGLSFSRRLLGSLFGIVGILGAACSDEDAGTGGGSSTATPPLTGGTSGGVLGGDKPGGEVPSDLNACATSVAKAEKGSLYLVFLFDRSLSMFGARLANRWGPCKAATLAFFGAPSTDGGKLHASLEYFPHFGGGKIGLMACDAESYTTPVVAMTALPSTAFKQTLDATVPEFGTPIQPAMTGAITYAKTIATDKARDGKVAIVLVSDGEPVGCGSSVEGTATIAKGVADTIPTYVIGVGDTSALNAIAVAGGTKQAILVKDQNAKETEASFRAALEGVRTKALACEYAIPAAPSGEKLDPNKVNIVHKPQEGGGGAGGGAAPATILRNQQCAGRGWRYDNESAPTRVILCPESCAELEAKAGRVDVLFGCATQDAPVK
jgi:hypothetical protein